jgi:hypothetical protein
MRIPLDLIEFIKEHTKNNGKTVTSDYVEYLENKRRVVESNGAIDASNPQGF